MNFGAFGYSEKFNGVSGIDFISGEIFTMTTFMYTLTKYYTFRGPDLDYYQVPAGKTLRVKGLYYLLNDVTGLTTNLLYGYGDTIVNNSSSAPLNKKTTTIYGACNQEEFKYLPVCFDVPENKYPFTYGSKIDSTVILVCKLI